MNKGFIIRKLYVVYVSGHIIRIILGVIEDLHSYNSEEKEYKWKDEKKSSDDRKNLNKSLEETFDLLSDLKFERNNSLAEQESAKKKRHPKYTINFEEIMNIWFDSDEIENYIECYKKTIHVVPSVCEVFLRTKCYDSYK